MRRSCLILASLVLFLPSSPLLAAGQLRKGEPAPEFTLPFATKDSISHTNMTLAKVIGGKSIVLAFYPADWTGGCTKEMCTFRDNFADLSTLDAQVYGISGDSLLSHREWADSLNLQFPLLSDVDHSVAKLYHSYNPETGNNRRTVFVIDRNGNLAYIDMAYKAGAEDSFDRLKQALRAAK